MADRVQTAERTTGEASYQQHAQHHAEDTRQDAWAGTGDGEGAQRR